MVRVRNIDSTIHQRHYATSLTRALVERFPATVWLVGSELVTRAAPILHS